MGKRIAISQSNYIPWKGYFDFINRVDEFVLYDNVQYTRRDWRNRNKIKTKDGLKWLTIPISSNYKDCINEVEAVENSWADKHWKTLHHVYKKASGYTDFAEDIRRLYDSVPGKNLSEINHHFLFGITKLLKINTPLTRSTDYKEVSGKTKRLVSICEQAKADIYVTGPTAKKYLDVHQFKKKGITVEWMEYDNYKKYPQIHGKFVHEVSILDLMFNTGHDARQYMKF